MFKKFAQRYLPKPNVCNIASGIGLNVNANKTEFRCFKQGVITAFMCKPLNFVGQFIYLGCNILSIVSDENIYIGKAWTAIERLSII